MEGGSSYNKIYGYGGNDTFVGHGALYGGTGDDTYFAMDFDVIVERAGEGRDTIKTASAYSSKYILKAGVEVEVLRTVDTTARGDVWLYGNEIGQTITGNAGSNSLRGYGGDDIIKGGAGNDRISGGPGNDILAGNTGVDRYYFSYALDEETNVDTITVYSGIDSISLNSRIFTNAGPVGKLSADAFVANAEGVATTANHRIIYETDTGVLRYDPDGTGEAEATTFAIIGNVFAMNADDFVIA